MPRFCDLEALAAELGVSVVPALHPALAGEGSGGWGEWEDGVVHSRLPGQRIPQPVQPGVARTLPAPPRGPSDPPAPAPPSSDSPRPHSLSVPPLTGVSARSAAGGVGCQLGGDWGDQAAGETEQCRSQHPHCPRCTAPNLYTLRSGPRSPAPARSSPALQRALAGSVVVEWCVS